MHKFLWRAWVLVKESLFLAASVATIMGGPVIRDYVFFWWNWGKGWWEGVFVPFFGEWSLFAAGIVLILVVSSYDIYLFVRRRIANPPLEFVGMTVHRSIYPPSSGDEPQEGPAIHALCFRNTAQSPRATIVGVSFLLTYYGSSWQKLFSPLTGAWINTPGGGVYRETIIYLDAGPVDIKDGDQGAAALLLTRSGGERAFAMGMESCPYYEWMHQAFAITGNEFYVCIEFVGKNVKKRSCFAIKRRGEELGGVLVQMPLSVRLAHDLPRFVRRLFL